MPGGQRGRLLTALLLTDAPLLYPPGQMGLAAMRSGFNKV